MDTMTLGMELVLDLPARPDHRALKGTPSLAPLAIQAHLVLQEEALMVNQGLQDLPDHQAQPCPWMAEAHRLSASLAPQGPLELRVYRDTHQG